MSSLQLYGYAFTTSFVPSETFHQATNFLRFTHNRFSQRAIRHFEPFVLQKVDHLCEIIAQYKESGQVLAVNDVLNAFAGDVAAEYAFGFNYNHLGSNNFGASFYEAFMAVGEFGNIILQFPWITPVSIRIDPVASIVP